MLSDRGMDRVALYPRYLLLGAGEGNFNRFLKAAQQNEIHCSFLNIWFRYGVIPNVLLLLLYFRKKEFQKVIGIAQRIIKNRRQVHGTTVE